MESSAGLNGGGGKRKKEGEGDGGREAIQEKKRAKKYMSACLSGRVRRPLYSFDSTQPLGCLGGSVVRASV